MLDAILRQKYLYNGRYKFCCPFGYFFTVKNVFMQNDIFNISTFEQANTYQVSMNRRDVRFYKITVQLPLGKPDATFKRKSQKLDKPDVDFSN